MILNFNGKVMNMSCFRRLLEVKVRNLNLFDFTECKNLEVLTEVHTFEMINVKLPRSYTLPKNLQKFTCFRHEILFEPNKLLVDCDIVNSEIMNKSLLVNCSNLKRLRCNVESSEKLDFSLLQKLEFLSLTFGHSLCSVVKLPKSLETLLLYK